MSSILNRTLKSLLFCALSLSFSLASIPAKAERFEAEKVIKVSTLKGWRNFDGTHITALRIDLAPGWVTYWRVPGDSGIPLQYDWRGSENIRDLSIIWPKPLVEEKYGLTSFVYRDSVVLPFEVSLADSSKDALLDGVIELGVCKDICVPVKFNISQHLTLADKLESSEIKAAIAAAPRTSTQAGLTPTECEISSTKSGLSVRATTKTPSGMGQIRAVIEHADQSLWVSPTVTRQDGQTVHAQAEIENGDGTQFSLQRKDLRISLLGTSQMIDIQGCVGAF